MRYDPEMDDERGAAAGRAYTPWRPLEPALQALLDHLEAEGLAVLTDEQLSELQERFNVAEPPEAGGAGTLRFNLIGYHAEVRRMLLERGWMFYSCGHWHRDSAADALDAPPTRGNPCGALHEPAAPGDGAGGRSEARARAIAHRHEHPH